MSGLTYIKTKRGEFMRIITDKQIEELEHRSYQKGYVSGIDEGERRALEIHQRNEWREIVAEYSESPVVIEKVVLKREPKLTDHYYLEGYHSHFKAALYEITFRGKNIKEPVTIEMKFKTQDFSMSDIKRRITREFCECTSEKGGR